jgi:hypothetical protein
MSIRPSGTRWGTFASLACHNHDLASVSIALAKDDSAIVFGEDVAFGGVFRCTMVSYAPFLRYLILTSLLTFGRAWQKSLVGYAIKHLYLQRFNSFARSGACL